MASLSLLSSAVRMAGPREVLLNAIMRQNYGCSHMIVGPEHASPPGQRQADAVHFYDRYDAQEMMEKHQDELEIKMVPVREMRYLPRQDTFLPEERITEMGEEGEWLTELELRYNLEHCLEVPSWFSYPDVISELRKVYPPRSRKGLTLFFTGLSGCPASRRWRKYSMQNSSRTAAAGDIARCCANAAVAGVAGPRISDASPTTVGARQESDKSFSRRQRRATCCSGKAGCGTRCR